MKNEFNKSWYGDKAKLLKYNEDCAVIDYGCNGKGIISSYNLFDGISLCFLDFDTEDIMPSQIFHPDMISIVYCHSGRYECEFSNHQVFYLPQGSFAIMGTKHLPISFSFPLKKCYAFSLVIDKPNISNDTKNILEKFNLDIYFTIYCISITYRFSSSDSLEIKPISNPTSSNISSHSYNVRSISSNRFS